MGKFLHNFFAPIIFFVGIIWLFVVIPHFKFYPPIGVYIAILAFLAAIMSFWPPDNKWAKAAWLLIFVITLLLEIQTLYHERKEQNILQANNIADAERRFAKTIDRLDDVLANQRASFTDMLAELKAGAKEERRQFTTLLKKEEHLFDKQGKLTKELFDRLNRTATETLEKAKEREGILTPSDLPNPITKCRIPSDSLAIYLGDTVGDVTAVPYTVLRVHGEDVITLNKSGSGFVFSGDIYDDRRDLILRMENNQFRVTNAAAYIDKTKSRLTVYDHKGELALSIRILNPNAIRIIGAFYAKDGTKLSIGDKTLQVKPPNGGSLNLTGCCVSGYTGLLDISKTGGIGFGFRR